VHANNARLQERKHADCFLASSSCQAAVATFIPLAVQLLPVIPRLITATKNVLEVIQEMILRVWGSRLNSAAEHPGKTVSAASQSYSQQRKHLHG